MSLYFDIGQGEERKRKKRIKKLEKLRTHDVGLNCPLKNTADVLICHLCYLNYE